MEDLVWSRINSELVDQALTQFEQTLQMIFEERNDFEQVLSEELDKLEKELKISSEHEMQENLRKRKSFQNQVSELLLKCTEEFDVKMGEAVGHCKSKESLDQAFENLLQRIVQNFEMNCKTANKFLKEKSIDQLRNVATKTFTEIEDFFKLKMKAETAEIKVALMDAKQVYVRTMEGNFRDKNGYFSEDELAKLHVKAKNSALQAMNSESLSQEQIEEVKQHLATFYEKYRTRNDLIWRSFQDEDPAIGIDLGTTYCCVAAYHRGKVVIIRNTQGDNTTPSYIGFQPDDSAICGRPAKELAFRNPESTIFDVKRIIGRRIKEKHLQEDIKYWPFTVKEVEGVTKIEAMGKTYYPEEISAMLLKHLKKEAEQILGKHIKKAVITVPAYFTDGQRKATKDAGEIAGLEVLGILNEPTAAAAAYRHEWFYEEADTARRVLVFDLGGGTFDVVILEMGEDQIEERIVTGDDHLGGKDFDKNLMNFCAEKFMLEKGIDLLTDKVSSDGKLRLGRLVAECEDKKKQLTTAPSATISIPAFYEGHDLIVEVSRNEFEKTNEKLFQKCIAIVDDALNTAHLRKEDIDDVVLVGGSTRIPRLQKLLMTHFNGKTLNKKINPDEAVAYGAAIQAAILSKPGRKLFNFKEITEVTPMSYGIECLGKKFSVIIPRGTKIPTKSTQTYWTSSNFQTNVHIAVFQGEKPISVENRWLGDFILDGIPPAMAGKEALDVTMEISADGILNVKTICLSTGKSDSIEISEDRGRMSEEVKRQLINKV